MWFILVYLQPVGVWSDSSQCGSYWYTCSLSKCGLIKANVVHIGKLVELVCDVTDVVAERLVQLAPLTLQYQNKIERDRGSEIRNERSVTEDPGVVPDVQ